MVHPDGVKFGESGRIEWLVHIDAADFGAERRMQFAYGKARGGGSMR
jgi:hypothetical protein